MKDPNLKSFKPTESYYKKNINKNALGTVVKLGEAISILRTYSSVFSCQITQVLHNNHILYNLTKFPNSRPRIYFIYYLIQCLILTVENVKKKKLLLRN